jgi:hypothetical protein
LKTGYEVPTVDIYSHVDIALVKVNEEFKVGISGKLLLPGKDWTLPGMVYFFSIIALYLLYLEAVENHE